MIIIVDERSEVTEAYRASFSREGQSATGFDRAEFEGWFGAVSVTDLAAVDSIIMGSIEGRDHVIAMVKSRTQVPVTSTPSRNTRAGPVPVRGTS